MNRKTIDPREQFSKKLAGRTEWFWFLYMLALVVAIIIAPESGMSAVYLGIMVTVVMAVSVIAYTKNSIDEKWFYWAAEIAKAIYSNRKNDEQDDEEEGGSNG